MARWSRQLPVFLRCFCLATALSVGSVAARGDVETSVQRASPRHVVFVVVDTLRADRLTASDPALAIGREIERTIAKPGVVVTRAYAPAPWTLPSMMGVMTGRLPGTMVDDRLDSFRIPADVPTLAERLRQRGMRTAAFIANPTLAADLGFHRGFDDVWVPPAQIESLSLAAAETVQPRSLAWLAQHGVEPFFLYVHYLDPHDPYSAPSPPIGLPPTAPSLPGSITGYDVHALYSGARVLADPTADLPRLRAFYDDEVRYVDRCVGELMDTLPPSIRDDTLVILTADHGEEFLDHGGWKHGQTLYEEQTRVPLLVRWDGGLVAGRRIDSTMSLIDVVPTVLEALGAEPAAGLEGKSRWRDLTTGRPSEPATVVVQGLAPGPLRAAVVAGALPRKLILFDRFDQRQPGDALQAHLATQDRARMRRVELYDLTSDPREIHDIAPANSGEVARLGVVLMGQLDRHIAGIRVAVKGVDPGVPVTARLRFDGRPSAVRPLLLDDGDRLVVRGEEVSLDIRGDPVEKGFVVDPGVEVKSVIRAELVVAGREIAIEDPRIAQEPPDRGRPVTTPTLAIWRGRPQDVSAGAAPAPQEPGVGARQAERLRALGYLQ